MGELYLTKEDGEKAIAWQKAEVILKRDTKGFKPDWRKKNREIEKWFVAWDKHQKDWVTKFLLPSDSNQESDDWTCPLTLGVESNWLNNDQLIICQSTNLFDKDGKEIFEGSIVRDFDDEVGVVYYDSQEGQYWAKFPNGDSTAMDSPSIMKVMGHILSNPELLEEKDV